ncbi:MAG TPA: hypothetical protein VGM88_06100 [Kofleriaceae bacterium]
MKRLALILLVACTAGEHRTGRDAYNRGVAALKASNWATAEKELLAALSDAGVDPELRYRAAYDLGLAYASDSDAAKAGKEPDLQKALDLALSAKSWFADAERHRPGDADAKTNGAIMATRAAALSDEINKGAGKLEARLDALIGQQRGVWDGTQQAWLAVKKAGGGNPLAQQTQLSGLADRERGVIAEAGVIEDLAADEIDSIGKKPEDKRTDEEKGRIVQLKNLDLYMGEARSRIAEARKSLQDLAAEVGVDKAEAALVALKRAREQLVDPITVLRGIAQEEVSLLEDTGKADPGAGKLLFGDEAPAPSGPVPAWLSPVAISDRQSGLRDRVDEVRSRLEAASSAEPPKDAKPNPQRDKMMAQVRAALPSIGEASSAMVAAHNALRGSQWPVAVEREGAATDALAAAIEQFSNLRQTIDIAYAEQQQVTALLVGDDKLAPQERAKRTADGIAHNLARIERLKDLIADEAAKPADPKADPKQVEEQKALYQQAEALRVESGAAVEDTKLALEKKGDPIASSRKAEDKLHELQKLFFSVIEHLQELIREQGDTADQTSKADVEDDLSRAPKLPGLVTRETGHGEMAQAIHDALAAQADAAAKKPADPMAQQQGPDPKALADAAGEVQAAKGDMSDATHTLTKARDATAASERLKPAVDSEGKALEHLQEALKKLQPPPKKNDQKQDQQKQDQQKQDQKKDQQQQQQQQGGAAQRARDEDAKKQRDRHEAQGTDPVDQDW